MAQNETALMKKTKNELVGIIIRKDIVEASLKEKIDVLEKTNNSLNENIENMEAKFKKEKSFLDDKYNNLNNLNNKYNKVVTENQKFKEEISNFKTQLEDSNFNIINLKKGNDKKNIIIIVLILTAILGFIL